MPATKNHVQPEWVCAVADAFEGWPGRQVGVACAALQVRDIDTGAGDFAVAAVDIGHAVVAVEGFAEFLHQRKKAAVAAAAQSLLLAIDWVGVEGDGVADAEDPRHQRRVEMFACQLQ